ncbi:MAG: ATP-binding protein [Pseudomonadota bacterium]
MSTEGIRRRLRRLSLTARLTIGAALWGGAVLAVTGLILVGLFRDHVERQFDATLHDHLIRLVAITQIDDSGAVRVQGQVAGARFTIPFSGWAWQIRQGGAIVAQSVSLGPMVPGVMEALQPPVDPGDGRVADYLAPGGIASRAETRTVTVRDGTDPLIFVVSMPQSDLAAAEAEFQRAVLIAFSALGLGLIVANFFLMRTALRPFAALLEKVASIRDGRREAPRPWPRELAPIADELDGLQAHIDRLVERARGEAADLAHAVKTPLSVLKQLAVKAPEAMALPMRRQVDRINTYLDRHLSRSRAAGTGHRRAEIAASARDIVTALGPEFEGKGLEVALDVPDDLVFHGDEADLYELLGNLVDNARKWARWQIQVSARTAEHGLVVEIGDDGPGVPEAERERIFARGQRLDEAAPGHGLGLTIVREIVQLYGGGVTIDASPLGGARVTLRIPGGRRPAEASRTPALRLIRRSEGRA